LLEWFLLAFFDELVGPDEKDPGEEACVGLEAVLVLVDLVDLELLVGGVC